MSDNVGLSTPRGSGTSGYVQRNLAHMRPRDMAAPYQPRDLDSLKHKQRQPDKGLLEHERKREVEVKVFELRDKLEEEGIEEEEIDSRCDELRKKLLAEMEKNQDGDRRRGSGGGGVGPRRNFKMHQVHELADAKMKESERLRQALKISKDYEEGSHWRRQEERLKKAMERDAEDGKDDRGREREGEGDPDSDRNRGRDWEDRR
ncbi:RNA-splicing factor [Madurella fahalii]|uniref:RNA-splicing factor n=1 Tax=Madurella fahalii TaxID=1157608 RepID=A0ABQ0GQX6_9PEZI